MIDKTRRTQILNQVIARLGTRRAVENKGDFCLGQSTPNPHGFDGVDTPRKGVAKYRARIRFSDCANGNDTRITLGTFDTAVEAGVAYIEAHIRLWGSASRYSNDRI